MTVPARTIAASGLDHRTAGDVVLFERARDGDYGAFEEIVRRYHERVYRLALGMLKTPQDAEEVVQDTFLNVFRYLSAFKHESAPASWIYRVAVNAALMRLRSRRRKPLLSLEDQSAVPKNDSDVPFWPRSNWARRGDDSLLSQELADRIEKAIEALPEKYRLVLVLRDVEGQSNEEVASTLGLTVPTVKSRLHRARLVVRGDLERYFGKK